VGGTLELGFSRIEAMHVQIGPPAGWATEGREDRG